MVVVRTLEGTSSFGGHKYKWEDNIKIDIKELGIVCSLDPSGPG
jgi:hypothetical protein